MMEDRKLSELEGAEREQVLAYVKSRWSQYYGAKRDALKDAAKLIAVTNAGGAAVALAFMGAIIKESPTLAKAMPMKLTILFFAFGVLNSALAYAVEYSRLGGLFAKWQAAVARFHANDLGFDTMQSDDANRAQETEAVSSFFIWVALACAAIGAALGVTLIFQTG